MTEDVWSEATFAGHERAQRRRAASLTPVQRLDVVERLVRDAARAGVLVHVRARRQREVMASWEQSASWGPELPHAEFAFPGPLRDRLVAAIMDGSKTSTTALLEEHEHSGEPLPVVGERSLLVDSDDRPVAVLEVTGVRAVQLGDVDMDHVRDEGEGHDSIAAWRAAHEFFWHSERMRAELGDRAFTATDQTHVVLERFQVVARLA